MPKIRLKMTYGVRVVSALSSSELVDKYLFGIPMCSNDGRKISSETIQHYINTAQATVENLLGIKISKQVIEESKNFIRQEFVSWGYIQATYPVRTIDNLQGWINGVCQINYPKEWLSLKKTDEVAMFRNIYLIPNTGSSSGAKFTSNSIIYNGISPHLGWFGKEYIPNYWRFRYVTGWDKCPDDLKDLIGKFAAINVLAIIGDILYGVGMTSISISLDGVSQNTPLTRSGQGGLFAGRIKLYTDQINEMMPAIKQKYRGIQFNVL